MIILYLKLKYKIRYRTAKFLQKIGYEPKNPSRKISFLITLFKSEEIEKLGASAVEHLLPILKDPYRRRTVANVLGSIGDTRAVEPLINALNDRCYDDLKYDFSLREYDFGFRACAVKALGKIGDARAIKPIVDVWTVAKNFHLDDWIVSKNIHLRRSAVIALGNIEDARTIDHLRNALSCDENINVRIEAVLSLLKLGWEPDKHFLTEKEEAWYWAGLLIYRNLKKVIKGKIILILIEDIKYLDQVVSVLIEILGSDYCNRSVAADELGRIGNARAVEPLISALKEDKDSWARSQAAEALGKIKDIRAVPSLIAALNDNDEHVPNDASRALHHITGQDFGKNESKWQEWFRQHQKKTAISYYTFDTLSISELANSPLFPIVPKNMCIAQDNPLYPLLIMRQNKSFNVSNPPQDYIDKLKAFMHKYPKVAEPYAWLSTGYMKQGQYEKAKEIICEGLTMVNNKSLLAFMFGSINLRQHRPVAIGWYMQSCLLATIEFIPYLLCARVAEAIGGEERLYRRLLNASDIMSKMKRVPDDEEEIKKLARSVTMRDAISKFAVNMDKFLPAEDLLPKEEDFHAREIVFWKQADNHAPAIKKLLRQE